MDTEHEEVLKWRECCRGRVNAIEIGEGIWTTLFELIKAEVHDADEIWGVVEVRR